MVHLLLVILICFSPDPEVVIRVSNVEATPGKLMLAVYDSPKTFMKDGKQILSRSIEINQTGTVTFSISLPKGVYAFAVFQDENLDGKLNKNFVGMPKEAYGFSNSDSMMPPDFDQAKVKVSQRTAVEINLR